MNNPTNRPDPQAAPRISDAFLVVTVAFVAALVAANLIAVKLAAFGPLVLPAAVIVFPLSYIVGDVLTEVYGYARARQVIWLGFGANLFVVASIVVGQALPPAPFWSESDQAAYQRILGATPKILLASFAAYLVGEFANAAVLARVKVATAGRFLWLRTISSTVVGQGLDSLVFITLAFGFNPTIIVSQWLFKTAYEVLATPLTYAVVGTLKRIEGTEFFDRETSWNPLRWSTKEQV
jgi:queuosine precursor transporter